MYLKLLIIFTVLVSFSFVQCFKERADLMTRYKNEKIYKNGQLNLLNANLCEQAEQNIIIRLNICRCILKLLRDDADNNNPFQLYMNYKAFTSTSNSLYPVCEVKFVEYNENILGSHVFMNCYGHLAIASENNLDFENNISIVHGPENSVMVFKCADSFSCELIEWYKKNELSKNSPHSKIPALNILDIIIATPKPKTADAKLKALFENKKIDVKFMSMMNSSNVIMNNEMTGELFEKLCDVLIRRPNYQGKYKIVSWNNRIKKPKSDWYQLTIYNPFIIIKNLHQVQLKNLKSKNINVLGFTCNTYVTTDQTSRTFKIMAGPNETSIILIEPTICNGIPCLVPAELVENMTLQYIVQLVQFL